MSRIRSLSEIFAKNRTEELPDDLWKMFVHPRNEGRFDLKKWTKPTVLVGGRGSGKTMFLKYHCHPTTFSPKKDIIRNEDFEFIGFHWRPDTFFTQNINEKLLGEKWERSFNSLMTLTLLIDFAKMLENILRSKFNSKDEIEKIASFELPKPIRQKLGIKKEKFIDCKEELEDINFDLCNWINSPDSSIPPSFIDLVSSLKLITERLSINISVFQKSIFTIFVDEFENLTNQQQKIINTWLKHSSQNLIFSIAHKKHSEVSRETKSQEKIVGRNDFRLIDLDEIYSKDFENLAAEVFVLKWIQDNHITELEEFIDICSDPELISTRRSDKYLKNIKFIVQKILPKTTMSEISEDILKNNALNNKLKNLIDSGLKLHNSDYLISDFLDPNYKQASIVNGALLNRKSKSMFPEILHKEFL
ncbi:hypothetical protein HGG82_10300 [Marinomonas sp. M1K-6]|uniref:Uncharacterized protein n=1 Tax=Marinomonas profundi TaxID=2726122 RepID=A0A847RA11_9GAMM|nr:hypothetical protein [Marinomonas profundi]NLQ18017.1 hypothetical protein [Marinomonas profundi]UDV01741.1 hypothetical protein J8N69_08930 [Marinomonas profundi]